MLFRLLDLIRRKSIVAIENPVAKQHFLLTWTVLIISVSVIVCQQ